MLDLVPCYQLPFLMIAAAIAGAAFLIFGWATYDPKPLPAWRWGDKARRRPKVRIDILSHLIGSGFAAIAATYAVSHPLCG